MTKILALIVLLPLNAAGQAIVSGGASSAGLTTSSAAATYVNKAGDTMTGRLIAPDATLTYGLSAATAAFSSGITASSVTSQGKFTSKHAGYNAEPNYTFVSDENTGLYQIAADRVGLAAGGVAVFDGNSAGTINMSGPSGGNIGLTLYGGLAYGSGGSQGITFHDGSVQVGIWQTATGNMFFDANRGAINFRTSSSGGATTGLSVDTSQNVTVPNGSLAVAGSTFTVATTGIVSAPSQPTAILTCNSSCVMTGGAATWVHWDTNQSVTQGMHSVSVSSENITIPAGGGGLYHYDVLVGMTDPGAGGLCYLNLYKNTSTLVDFDYKGRAAFPAGDYNQCRVSGMIVLAAGDTLSVKFTQNRGGADFNLATIGFPANHFHLTKAIR